MQTSQNTVLITGGTSGIGLALAKRFLDADNAVIVTGRDASKLSAARAALPALGTVQADMTDPQALAALATSYPAVNVLVNNAAVQHNYALSDPAVGVELIESELRTNLLGPLALIKLMLPQLLAQPSAAIVNVTSGLALVPKQSAAVYCASKAGLRSFTKALRWQLEASNVRVFELIPPLVDTPMTHGRGRGKLSPEAVAAEFWHGFARDRYEMPIGRTRLLMLLQRLLPTVAERRMRPGL